MSFKFGLTVKNKAANGPGKPVPGKRKPIFDDDDEDKAKSSAKAADGAEEIAEFNFDERSIQAPEPTKPKPSAKPKGKPPGPPSRPLQAKKDDPTAFASTSSLMETETVDASVYDYDAAYDALQARTAAKKAIEEDAAQERQPRYMETLFESAEVRKMDRLRARDKLLQREREAEGDEFADKAKFVTGAYKAHQEETRRAEEEERVKQELEEKKRRNKGMQGFHRNMLLEDEKRHAEAQAAMEEAAQMIKNGVQPITLEQPKEKPEAEIAQELNAQGKNIIIDDQGQIADKRQLLSAGLNVVAKPKPATAVAGASARPSGPSASYQGRNPAKGAMRERQTAMIAQQIEQAAKRKADEEAEEQRKLEHASKSRKTDVEIGSAKERYLQRKREAAAAKAAAESK